ncbi:protein-disulfide reductase DsbD [Piscinibacter sp. HJYY11]|uniref:protein-disulfide reductase DsbD family protein n=1 Tax=Piscinibacter sp. HJYY11 TaxID=2801333 RepID=UPI00191E8C5D|nr:protein-disulfide reductase DsbD domain-containing protein [Piscinibacter sp. HJYY11]MBL0726527.1 thioredoxin family protein [Piscinibacter sp. HJYY11]
MPLNASTLWPALLLALAAPCVAHAQATAKTEQVEVRLVSAAATVQPGQSLLVGLQQKIIPHWHTYWVNPGDSGLPTTIAWTLPAGATASPIHWPTPSRYSLGPITNYGYADEVTLPSVVQVPTGLRDGDRFELKAKVDWLVCNDVCIPQNATLSLTLPVGTAATPSGDASLLQQAQARVPQRGEPASWQLDGGKLQLAVPKAAPAHDGAYFFARKWGLVAHAEPQQLQQARLVITPGDNAPKAGDDVDGVLVLLKDGKPVQSLAIGHDPASLTPVPVSAAAPGTAAASAPSADQPSLWLALGLALLGGLILNLMPCVFPVLTIKVLSLLHTAQGSRRVVRLHGLAYLAGVLASFAALAGVLIALKAGGDSVGWGFQFQSPVFVLLVALLMFAVGLSLSGVVNLGGSAAGIGQGLASQPGLRGSFFTGVLATVVATPCTAPFMGVAIGYAVTQPAGVTLAVFLALGLGLALPYLLLCEWPALQRRLPRPGAWMDRLKQALAFPMYASAAWLAWVLARQAGPEALAVALAGAIGLALAAWLYSNTRDLGPRGRHASAAIATLLVVGAVGFGTLGVTGTTNAPQATTAAAHGGWEPYTPERLATLRQEGKPVFVNLTADWCITCLVNERVALSPAHVDDAFRQAGITRLKGDWTRGDERITKLLAEHGRSGVPLYLFYPPGAQAQPQVLPQLLTPDLVLAALKAPASP